MHIKTKPGEPSLFKRGEWYFLRWYVDGKVIRKSLGTKNYSEALNKWAEKVEELDNPKEKSVKVSWVAKRYLANKKEELEKKFKKNNLTDLRKKALLRNYKDLESRFNILLKFFKNFYVDNINMIICNKFIEESLKRNPKLSNATLQTYLLFLRACLNYGAKCGWYNKNYYVYIPEDSSPRQRYLNNEEIKRLIDACEEPHLKLFTRIAIATGRRSGAILELLWEDVDFETNTIIFRKEVDNNNTNKRRGYSKFGENLRMHLLEAYSCRETDHAIEFRGRPILSIKKSFAAACRRVDLIGVTPHILRHTAGTLMARDGVSTDEIANILGISPAVAYKHYIKFTPDYNSKGSKVLDSLI